MHAAQCRATARCVDVTRDILVILSLHVIHHQQLLLRQEILATPTLAEPMQMLQFGATPARAPAEEDFPEEIRTLAAGLNVLSTQTVSGHLPAQGTSVSTPALELVDIMQSAE
jgi:hypothetical protein